MHFFSFLVCVLKCLKLFLPQSSLDLFSVKQNQSPPKNVEVEMSIELPTEIIEQKKGWTVLSLSLSLCLNLTGDFFERTTWLVATVKFAYAFFRKDFFDIHRDWILEIIDRPRNKLLHRVCHFFFFSGGIVCVWISPNIFDKWILLHVVLNLHATINRINKVVAALS